MKMTKKTSEITSRWREKVLKLIVKYMAFLALWRPGSHFHIYDIQPLAAGGRESKKFTAYINDKKMLLKVIPKEKWRGCVNGFFALREQCDEPNVYGSLFFFKRYMRMALYIRPWVEGKTLKDALYDLDGRDQYDLGKRVVESITNFHRTQYELNYLDSLEEHLLELLNICKDGELDLYGHADGILSQIEQKMNMAENRPVALVHCDLKPDNIIIDTDGNPVLIDFEGLRSGDPLWDWAHLLRYFYHPRSYDYKAFCLGMIDQLEKKYSKEIWELMAVYRAILLMSIVERSGRYSKALQNPNTWKGICEDLKNPIHLRDTLSRQNAKKKIATKDITIASDSPHVSVIIPVWNPGLGILRCIESLQNQTLEDIEMIFVYDCGTDNSLDKVLAAAEDDPRIRILKNEKNLGPGPSLNRGIEEARGEYLSFVDPEDYIALDFLEKLYEEACILSHDVVKGVVATVEKSGVRFSNNNQRISRGIASGTPLYRLFSYEHQSAIYRREFISSSKIKYGDSRRYQETTFLFQVTSNAPSFIMVETAYYYRCLREDSTLQILDSDQIQYCADAIREQIDCVLCLSPDDENAELYLRDRFLYYLKEYERYECIPSKKEAAEKCLKKLRRELTMVPYCDKLAEHSYSLRILRDYGVGLSEMPYLSPFEEDQTENNLRLLNRWLDFYKSYPQEREVSKKYIARIGACLKRSHRESCGC